LTQLDVCCPKPLKQAAKQHGWLRQCLPSTARGGHFSSHRRHRLEGLYSAHGASRSRLCNQSGDVGKERLQAVHVQGGCPALRRRRCGRASSAGVHLQRMYPEPAGWAGCAVAAQRVGRCVRCHSLVVDEGGHTDTLTAARAQHWWLWRCSHQRRVVRWKEWNGRRTTKLPSGPQQGWSRTD
jgi:hypothetical protein